MATTRCGMPTRAASRMPPGLGEHALAGVDEDDGEVGGGGGGHHVTGILLVAGGVGDDELARARAEVAVGHVNGDALLAFGLQAVGEERQVDISHAALCEVRSMADRVSARMVLVSNRRRPIRVLLPSSTLPQVREAQEAVVFDFSSLVATNSF